LQNQSLNADIPGIIESDSRPGAEGTDVGAGNASDYGLDESYDTLGAESRRPEEEGREEAEKPKKDTATKKVAKIGEATLPAEEKKEKKGLLRGIFGNKKDKDKKAEPPKPENDY
jgi:penicillin-binding protein 1A